MAELAPRLGGLVRRGVGLNTRAGAGRFITQVCTRLLLGLGLGLPSLLSPLVMWLCSALQLLPSLYPLVAVSQVTRRLCGDMQPLASGLIKALTEACRADRSPAVRRAYAAAAALLCRYAPGARVNKFIADALASLAAENADRDDRYVAGGCGVEVVWLGG